MHAHDETEKFLPKYYELFIGHLLEKGFVFETPIYFIISNICKRIIYTPKEIDLLPMIAKK